MFKCWENSWSALSLSNPTGVDAEDDDAEAGVTLNQQAAPLFCRGAAEEKGGVDNLMEESVGLVDNLSVNSHSKGTCAT